MHVLGHYISQYFNTSSFSNPQNNNSKKRKRREKKQRKNNATVYVIRRLGHCKNLPENQNCWLANSKPCTHCQSYLAKFGFKRVKYTDIINGENVLCELRLKKMKKK